MTNAERIAEYLRDKGIKHVFGIIGAGNVALFDAIARLGYTQIVCHHNEQASVGAAIFYGRTLETTGVAVVTTGAGSANAITGAIAALMDNVSVLIISGNEPSRYLKADVMRNQRVVGVQGFQTAKAVHRFVKWSAQAGDPLFTVPQEVDIAYRATLDRLKGPAWVDIPRDLFLEEYRGVD